MVIVLTQQNSIKLVPLKQCIPLQAIETTLCIKQTSQASWTWRSAPCWLGLGIPADRVLCVLQMAPHTVSHRLYIPPRSLINSNDCLLPTPILSPWTILNDDHGDYVLAIPARSLKECPCCVLNTQRRDYADPYMWCCGCIPPVRLNPICYRFGLKEERCSKQAGG